MYKAGGLGCRLAMNSGGGEKGARIARATTTPPPLL